MKRILTIQDISCVGQCSLTVALPIISAAGVEASVLPTAVLSTHTGGFKNFTFCDLTQEMPKIEKHWNNEKILFDGFYTGYIGSVEQIDFILSIFDSCSKSNALKVVDPCMADHGKLYPGFAPSFPQEMLRLCRRADVLVPNITEACLLTQTPYQEHFSKEELEKLAATLSDLTGASVVLTGVHFKDYELGSLTYDQKAFTYYFTERIPYLFHGTGDCFASAFFASMMRGKTMVDSAQIACEFTVEAIRQTVADRDVHWYGVHFEPALKLLIEKLA